MHLAPYRLHLLRGGIISFADSLVWTAMLVYQVQVIGMTPLQLVLAGTTMEVTIFLFEIPTGVVADVYSRRLSTIIGYVLLGVSYLIQGLIPAFGAILVGNAVWGLGHTFTSGAYDAWLVDEIGPMQAGTAFLRGTQVERITGAVGIVLAAMLGSIQLAIPIVVGGALMVGLALLLVVIMPETGFHPRPKGERASWSSFTGTFRDGYRVTRNQPILLGLLLIMFFFGLFSEGWDRLWRAHFLRTFALESVLAVPAVIVFAAFTLVDQLAGAVLAEFARRRVNTTSMAQVNRALFVLVAVMVGALVVFGLAPGLIVAFVAAFIFTQARGLTDPFFRTWTNQHIPEDSAVRATVLSMQSQAHAIGEVAGGPPVGLIGNTSLRLAFLGSAAFLTPVLVILRRVRRYET
ncbi:MAG TPA: MFS transporter [Candidatus Limnocylindrales bacterium]|nr:MFS transporter [Candidatus Limnocylindrales bacterium]